MTDPTHSDPVHPDLPTGATPPPEIAVTEVAPEVAPEVESGAAPSPDPVRLPPRHSGRSPVAVLGAIGFILVAAALFYLWQQIQDFAVTQPVDPARVALLDDQVRSLQQRAGQMEQRLNQLDQRQAAAPTAPARAAQPPVDLGPLESRITALEQRPAPAPAPVVDDGRIDALTKRLAQDEAQAQQIQKDLKAGGDRIARLRMIQEAGAALAAGQKLGPLTDAPPALARFSAAAPPTEAGLRLSFVDAAHRAVAASQPDLSTFPIAERMWMRIKSLVTVREGDKVIIGAPASEVLAEAQAKLNAGDLAGCIAALDTLDGPAAAAMADWRAQAQSLLDARAALAALARG